jgi:hypothetical protein
MSTRQFALVAGIAFIAVGILGFVPGVTTAPHAGHPDLAVDAGHGRLFGLFPVNVLHNLVHLGFGAWGILAYLGGGAVVFARGTAIIYAVLVVMGLVPALQTTFGLVPIFGHDVWLHAVIAAAAAYFGWSSAFAAPPRPVSRHA